MLGIVFGIIYDFFEGMTELYKSNCLRFILDVLMTLFCGFLFECVLIAFSGGTIRGINLTLCFFSFLSYFLIIHPKTGKVFHFVFRPVGKMLNFLSKKLKKSKKSCKKVLHFNK
ncbi:MAG: hypothetical protein IJT65_06700 [Eubacterium sp.]|nr:hypothetical protein [Eubacterium sp.]